LYNSKTFNQEIYDSSRIFKESWLIYQSFYAELPKTYSSKLQITTVTDATDWVQFGQSTNTDTLTNFVYGEPGSSSWNNYPTKYKFVGMVLSLDTSVTEVSRQTYDVLRMLGDVGGL